MDTHTCLVLIFDDGDTTTTKNDHTATDFYCYLKICESFCGKLELHAAYLHPIILTHPLITASLCYIHHQSFVIMLRNKSVYFSGTFNNNNTRRPSGLQRSRYLGNQTGVPLSKLSVLTENYSSFIHSFSSHPARST